MEITELRLFTPAPDRITAGASWTYDGWSYRVAHRTSGEESFKADDGLLVAHLTTEELLDVVCATWADRLGL